MINNVFNYFCEKIELDKEIINKIDIVKTDIVECIDEYFGTEVAKMESKYIGSYGRNTAVHIENIRLLLVIPSAIYLQISVDINEILGDMEKAMYKRFFAFERSGNGLNINIDGTLSFEVIPGFMLDEGVYIYLCNNRWKHLNLGLEKKMFNKMNLKFNNNLVDLCRILKVWKFCPISPDGNNIDISEISNILLDTFAYHFFDQNAERLYTYETYDEMLIDFLNFLLPNSKRDNFLSFDGKTFLKRKTDALHDKVSYSIGKANMAMEDINLGLYDDALQEWKGILGSMYLPQSLDFTVNKNL